MTRTVDLSVVVVSWECAPDLVACVRSLAEARKLAEPIDSELVVVDNASARFPQDEIQTLWPGALTVVNDLNRGFGPAANQGVGLAAGAVVLLLNPDTRADGDPFTPLLEVFADRPDVVAAAPALLDADPGTAKPQVLFQLRRLPSWAQAARELLLIDRAFPENHGLRRDRYLDRDRSSAFPVEQPAAAALAVRRDAFVAVGGFDERFVPAWWEDVDLCARLAAHGAILYSPSSRFVHVGGVAANALGYEHFLPLYYRNARRYWRKHHGATAALAYRLLVAAGMLLRLAALAVVAPAPHRRRDAARAYWRTLRSSLCLSCHPLQPG